MRARTLLAAGLLVPTLALAGCDVVRGLPKIAGPTGTRTRTAREDHAPYRPATPPSWDRASSAARAVAASAEDQVGKTVGYDAAYVKLGYPGGDVPLDRGVCTDVVIRAFRANGVDLQVKVHEDMTADFGAYPQKWGLPGPDASIDHRRVPNLQTYFDRARKAVEVTDDGRDYWPGDVVTWNTWGRPHTGVVSTVLSGDGSRYLIAHNFGRGTRIEDVLFAFPITGHYRYF